MGPPCTSRRNSTAQEYTRVRGSTSLSETPRWHLSIRLATDWNAMLNDVRAYVVAAEASPLGRAALDCGFGVSSLYNQVHIAWSLRDISAIFYVNDTVIAAHAHAHGAIAPAEGAEERAYLLEEARAAAARSYRAALMARLADLRLDSLPIVQFVVRSRRVLQSCSGQGACPVGQLRHGDAMIRPPRGGDEAPRR